MLDLETLDTKPTSAILSIGAARFDADCGVIVSAFYQVIDPDTCEAVGLTKSQETVDWWSRQSPEARTVLTAPKSPLKTVLGAFYDYMRDIGVEDVKLWGNGSDFDNVILANAYRAVGSPVPWAFWNNRCFRTVKGLAPGVQVSRAGIHHNALDDALHQVKHLEAIRMALGLKL